MFDQAGELEQFSGNKATQTVCKTKLRIIKTELNIGLTDNKFKIHIKLLYKKI